MFVVIFMVNQNPIFTAAQSKKLNIIIVETQEYQGKCLRELIKTIRPQHKVSVVKSLEDIFAFFYGEVAIDLIFFDVEEEANTDNIALIKAIAPEMRLIHWSNCQHPEIIDLLYALGVNSFCTKESDSNTIIEAIDLAADYPQSCYFDPQLHSCLPLLRS